MVEPIFRLFFLFFFLSSSFRFVLFASVPIFLSIKLAFVLDPEKRVDLMWKTFRHTWSAWYSCIHSPIKIRNQRKESKEKKRKKRRIERCSLFNCLYGDCQFFPTSTYIWIHWFWSNTGWISSAHTIQDKWRFNEFHFKYFMHDYQTHSLFMTDIVRLGVCVWECIFQDVFLCVRMYFSRYTCTYKMRKMLHCLFDWFIVVFFFFSSFFSFFFSWSVNRNTDTNNFGCCWLKNIFSISVVLSFITISMLFDWGLCAGVANQLSSN